MLPNIKKNHVHPPHASIQGLSLVIYKGCVQMRFSFLTTGQADIVHKSALFLHKEFLNVGASSMPFK